MASIAPPPPTSLRGVWIALRWPTAADLASSIKGVLAATLALTIGFSQNLDNPYWSALTIYVIIAKPQTGAIRSKALFRLLGTLLAGALAILLSALFASHIGVLFVATLAVMLVCHYAKLIDRTPASYTWYATSTAVAVMVIVHIQQPQTIFYYAATRLGEICLGILSIWLVDSMLLPRPMMPGFEAMVATWRGKAGAWAAGALAPRASMKPADRLARRVSLRALLALVPQLDAQGVQLPYDIVPVSPHTRDLRLLRLTVSRLLSHLAVANVWIEAVRSGRIDDPEIVEAVAGVRDWIGDSPDLTDAAITRHAEQAGALVASLIALRDRLATTGERQAMLKASAAEQLEKLVARWSDLERISQAITTGGFLPARLAAKARLARPARSIDYVASAIDALPLALTMSFITLFWFWTTWTSALQALVFAYICCSSTTAQTNTMAAISGVALWLLCAFALTFFYQFVVLPRVTSFPTLMLVLALMLVPLGILMSMTAAAMLVTAVTFAFLGLQNAYTANFETSLESFGGTMAGSMIALAALRLCSYDRPRFIARRLATAMRRDIRDVATTHRLPDGDRFLSVSVDRLATYFATLETLPDDDPLHHIDMTARFRVGAGLARLRRSEAAASPDSKAAIGALRHALALAYAGEGEPDRPALLSAIEDAYDRSLPEPEPGLRSELLMALTGLRIALTPDPAFEQILRDDGR